jgi:hypothetical protein
MMEPYPTDDAHAEAAAARHPPRPRPLRRRPQTANEAGTRGRKKLPQDGSHVSLCIRLDLKTYSELLAIKEFDRSVEQTVHRMIRRKIQHVTDERLKARAANARAA